MKSNDSSLTGFLCALALTVVCCLPAYSQTNGAGTAVRLNGTANAWLNVPNGNWFSGNFTVEAWVNLNSYNSWSRLIDFSDGSYNDDVYLALANASGYPTMGVFTNNNTSGLPTFSATTQLPLNQWVHLAATGNGTNGTIYLNGNPVGTGMLNIAPGILRTNNYIGRSAYSGDSYANASFDDLRIWNGARTRVQIQTEMNHSPVGNEAGLVGYWRFDEGSGTNAYDSTGNGNTAGLNSGVTWTNSTAPLTNAADYALKFSGSSAVTMAHQAAQDSYPLTVMCWFMDPTSNTAGGGALVGNYVSGLHNGWQIAISGTQLYAWYWRDANDDIGSTSFAAPVNDGLWHHVAFVVSSAGGVIYLDGVPKQTNTWAGTAGSCTTTEQMFLGIYQGDSLLTGDIDEVSVWNAALTQSQIQTYMHQPLQGTEAGLVNYYRMNEGIGTNIYDYTTNANTGVFSPTPPVWITSGAQMQEAPEVVTLPATTNNISVTLRGTLNPQGLNSGSWFRWGMTTGYGNVTTTNAFGASYNTSTNAITLTGLAPGTYHFQIVATNSSGVNYGADQSVTITILQTPPQVATLPATLNGTSATLSGSVNPEGLNSGSWFNWGLTTSYGNTTARTTYAASNNTSTNTSTLAGLTAGTYHFQIVATNAVGTNYGADQSFTIVTQFQLGNTNVVDGPASGEDSVVLAASPTNADWSATANASWLHLATSSGIGSTNVIFSFDTNSGQTRVGTLTIAGQTLTVTQAGSTYVQVFTPITLFSALQAETLGVAVDNQGNVYFSNGDALDEWNPTNNTVSTIIPYTPGTIATENMTVDSAGNLYIANVSPGAIDKWTATNHSLTALVPGLKSPSGIALDSSGDVYFSDLYYSLFDEWVATNSSVINLPQDVIPGIAVDAANNVYYDDNSTRVFERNSQSQSVTTLINYRSNYTPHGLAVDGGGNLYMVLANFAPYYEIEKWSAATGLQSTLVPTPPDDPTYQFIAVDSSRNLYFGITEEGNGVQPVPALQELPNAFVDATAKSEPPNAGNDSLPAVVPANINLTGPFAPASNQPWLTITGTANGVVSYSFTANTGFGSRTADIQLLGQSISISQAGSATLQLGYTNLLEGPITGTDSVIVVVNPVTAPPWTASANVPWLHLTATSLSGDTNLLFTFDANPGTTRTGTISIANQTLTVTQAPTNYVAAGVVTLDTNNVQPPYGMAMDSAGNIFWAGGGGIQEWIRTNDTVINLISNGMQDPISVAVDGADNLYIADNNTNAIWKWTAADGNLTILVGSGLNSPCGVALDAAGNVYIADQQNNAIKEWLAASSNVVTLVSTGLNWPSGVAVDLAGNVYIADSFNNQLKEWSPATGNVTVLASNGIATPSNIAVDGSGNVFMGEPGSGQVVEWSPDGTVSLTAYVSSYGAAVDSEGNIFMLDDFGDLGPSAIDEMPRAFLVPATKFEPFTGGNDSLPAVFPTNILQTQGFYPTNDQPWVSITGITNGVTSFSFTPNDGAPRSANIFLLGYDYQISQNAIVLAATNLLEGPAAGTDTISLAISPPLIPWTASANVGWLHPPVGYPTVAVPTNVIFSFDANPGPTRTGTLTLGSTLLNITQAGATYVASSVPLTALVTSGLSAPSGVAVDDSGYVYIANPGDQSVDEWVMASNSLESIVFGGLVQPTGVVFNNADEILFYSDTASNVVYGWAQGVGNQLIPFITSGLNGPQGLAMDNSHNVYIADSGDNAIKEYGFYTGKFATLVTGLNHPEGVAADAFGDVYIADTGNNAIEEWFAANSNLVTVVSSGLNQPSGVAVDASGNIFIADTGDNAIKELVALNGTLTTLVGTGLNHPTGIALDSADDLYVADTGNNAVEELPRAFVDSIALLEPYPAGGDSLPVVLPNSVNLLPPFAPISDQPWLTVTNTASGIVNFAFTANIGTTLSPRTAHLNVLGVSSSITQTNAPVVAAQLKGAQVLGNGAFQFTFTNTPGTTFTVLATTNLMLPLANWINLGTVSNISPGIYQFTTSPLTNSQEFYQVIWP